MPAEFCGAAGPASPLLPWLITMSKAVAGAGRPRAGSLGCVGSTTHVHALSNPLSVPFRGTSPNRRAQQC